MIDQLTVVTRSTFIFSVLTNKNPFPVLCDCVVFSRWRPNYIQADGRLLQRTRRQINLRSSEANQTKQEKKIKSKTKTPVHTVNNLNRAIELRTK